MKGRAMGYLTYYAHLANNSHFYVTSRLSAFCAIGASYIYIKYKIRLFNYVKKSMHGVFIDNVNLKLTKKYIGVKNISLENLNSLAITSSIPKQF